MNDSSFKILINKDVINFLKKVELFKGSGVKDIGDCSDEFKKISRKNSHLDLYNVAIKNLDYDIVLNDDSIFQFSKTDNNYRYAYIQNPITNVTKDDYLLKVFGLDEIQHIEEDEYNNLKLDIQEEDFEQFKSEQLLNLNSIIIRYDVDPKNYKPLNHSYSHIHFGLGSFNRVACSRILTPLSFVLFVIKNNYEVDLKIYEDFLLHKGDNVDSKFWEKKEEREIYLI